MKNIKTNELFLLTFSFNELKGAEEILLNEDVKVVKVKCLETNTSLVNDKEMFLKLIRMMRRGRFEVTYLKSC